MGVTIKQIAEAAGVCRATVDKVLHNRAGVSEEMRQHVLNIAETLQYRPNLIGQALKKQTSKVRLAAIILKLDSFDYLLEGIHEGMKDIEAFGVNVSCYPVRYPDVDAQCKYLHALLQEGIDGVIITPLDDPQVDACIDAMIAKNIPVIAINTDAPNSRRNVFIGQNMVQAGKTAAQLLDMILSGNGQIAALTASKLSRFDKGRIAGFLEYIERRPALQCIEIAETYEEPSRMYAQTQHILRQYPGLSALYITCGCVSDAVRAVTDEKREQDMHIVCFDSFPETKTLVQAGLIDCVIDQELPTQGRQAIQLLFYHIFGQAQIVNGEQYTPICIHIQENMLY